MTTGDDATVGGYLGGHLLIATPLIEHLPFHRSVVFVSEHDESGAIGVIVNSPSQLTVGEVLPGLSRYASDPAVIHLGGPVQTDTAIAVARSPSRVFARDTAIDDIGIVDPSEPPSDTTALRVFAGYSGWDPGQLEREIAEDSWWSISAQPEDVFTADADGLWERCVRRIRGATSLYATYPTDPDLN